MVREIFIVDGRAKKEHPKRDKPFVFGIKKKIESKAINMEETLKNFMEEFFPFEEFLKIGFFKKEMKGDYEAQAARVCKFFGFKTVYEYRAKEIRCHITYAKGKRPLHVDENGRLQEEPFITVMPGIYD